jgi:hypothetical protein
MKRKTVYRCEFLFKGEVHSVRSEEGIAAFKDGFWITADLKYTKGSDCRYWIPPTVIEYVAKDSVRS